jgi:hypothetical protein
MTTRSASIFCISRDENGTILGNTEVSGNTEDEGVTVVLGIGYLPALTSPYLQAGDVKVTVHQPAIEYPTAAVTSVTPDEENGLQTVVFNLAP